MKRLLALTLVLPGLALAQTSTTDDTTMGGWFKSGFAGGDISRCDTFKAARL